jgi:hypothetical protein
MLYSGLTGGAQASRRGIVRYLAPVAVAAVVSGAALAADSPNGGQDISGVWWATSYSPNIEPVGGGGLPFTGAGKAAYEKNMAGLKDGSIVDTARRFCTPDGVPRILATPYPFEIIQTPGQLTMIHELNHAIRIVLMNKPVPKDSDESIIAYPYYDGHSFGHWERDTLVIETLGFNERTFLDATGAPHTDAMHTTERIKKIDDGKELEDVVTVHDPEMYTKDWSARYVYDLRNDVHIEDYVCGEPHRDISMIKGIAGH